MTNLIYKDEAYELSGICMEVHNHLGPGLLIIIYKETIEWELDNRLIQFKREREYPVFYKGTLLRKRFNVDFIVYDKIILEVNSRETIINDDIAQVINYLKLSGSKLGDIVNFGRSKLEIKRLVN